MTHLACSSHFPAWLMTMLQLIPPELHIEGEKLHAGERIEHYETTGITRNGERFPISITIFSMRNGAEIIVGASKIVRNTSIRSQLVRNFDKNLVLH